MDPGRGRCLVGDRLCFGLSLVCAESVSASRGSWAYGVEAGIPGGKGTTEEDEDALRGEKEGGEEDDLAG